ncbi:Peptidase M16 domain protein [Croceitalea dokdonensis DOKDO 023]|uniref:Peptidase M16 domain protein n=1 Tax=Croceitalea dokdonensis DOKDO 023 TaxID=1300341 RepID=A0A0P7B3M1_9FLAO|nr:insulinase family protein [Croceitalea dokdonensis]KPM33128.1 Peptidase M16 domain protein [Croceitalea dokdonensis DOKDO 023]
MKNMLLCILCVGLQYVQGQTDGMGSMALPEENIPIDPNVKVGQLDNGLTYYIRNNGKPEDKVELRLVVNAGSIMETERQLGLAHFMEHMNFNGTKNFEKNDLVDYLQSIGVKFGADLNAYTSFDETVYILPIPSDDPEKLEKGFQIIEDWAHNTTLSEEAIDGERGVVLEELRIRLGAEERMQKVTLPKMMYGSRYAERLPIGTKENLENFSYDDVRDYYNTWYRPDLMAVIAVGDLDVATMEGKIKSHFSGIEKAKNPVERKSYELPNHEETLIAIAADSEAAFSRVQVMYKDRFETPVVKTVGDYRESLVKNLFSTLINNRLDELGNSAKPPFVFGYSYYGGTYARTKNAYQSIAQTSPEGQMDGLKAVLEENERVKRYGFQAGEFDRAKKSLLARLEKRYNDRDKQESNRMVNPYIYHYLENQPIPGIEWEYSMTKNLLPTIQLEEIGNLINTFLHDDNRVIVITGPEKEGVQQISEEAVRALLESIKTAEIAPYKDEAVRAELMETLPPAGSITATETNKKLGVTTFTLSNGAKVTFKKTDFKNDEVLFEAFSPGGTSLYSDEELKATAFANSGLSQAGIGGLSLTDMGKFMSGKIVRVTPRIGSFSENFSGSAAPKDLETLFQMVHLYFTSLNKDPEAFASHMTKQKSFLGNLMANPQFYFQDQLGEIQNEGNPRYTGFPTVEKMDASDYDLAYQKYQERFADAGDFHFYFVGNVDETELKSFAATYLASLPGKNSAENFVPTKFRRKDTFQKHIIKKGTDPKSNVRISWEEEIPYDGKTEMAIKALGEVLTIKLVEKLREDEGGVYGVGARGNLSKISFSNLTFSISFPCGPENVDKLVAAALGEVEKIKKDGVSPADMAKVKETYLVKRKEDLKTNKFWISNMVKADQEKRNLMGMMQLEAKLDNLKPKDIQKVAQQYLDENYFLGILMPETE